MEKNYYLIALKKQMADFDNLPIIDENYFNDHSQEFQDLAYVCMKYCQNHSLLSKILYKLAFSGEFITLSEDEDYQEETQKLIGLYAEEIITEDSNILAFVENCIIQNCHNITDDSFKSPNDDRQELIFSVNLTDFLSDDANIIKDIFDHLSSLISIEKRSYLSFNFFNNNQNHIQKKIQ